MSILPVFRLRPTSKPSVPETTPTFESCLGSFALDTARHDSPIDNPVVAAQIEAIDPATSERNGSITRDRQRHYPTHEWNSLEEFHAWRMKEELDHGMELINARSRSAGSPLWRDTRTYVCSRERTGGMHKYVKKHEDRIRTRPIKKTGCRCKVVVKTYHHTSTVLGWYRAEHDHVTGVANLRFTRLQDSTRAYVLSLLRRHMKPKEVLMRVRREHSENERGHYITMTDIYRLRRIVKREEATRSISSDPPSDEYPSSETSPAKDEELMMSPRDVVEAQPSQVCGDDNEDEEVSDEQSTDKSADPGSPTSSSISHFVSPEMCTPGATANTESTALSVLPATPVNRDIAPPMLPLRIMPYQMPPPLIAYIPYPPYQMTLYPLYPLYVPPPTF